MLDLITLLAAYSYENLKLTLLILTIISYLLYYSKYGFYIFKQKNPYTIGKHRIGNTLPPYPNGWFTILASSELKKGETKYVDSHGESLAVFRGNNGKVYVIGAFCPHLGANLGIGGSVINDSCIQCPFHAWTFDGETGNCMSGKDTKEGIKYEYEFEGEKCEFKPKVSEKVTVKKYICKEVSAFIHVWFDQEGRLVPPYEPFDVTDRQEILVHRGRSLNKVNSHLSDIAENGGDITHFLYIHPEIIPFLIKGAWSANWLRGDDPELRNKLKLKNEKDNNHRTKLLDKYITAENSKYIGVIHIYNEISMLGLPFINFFCLTGFQVGPGLVYLFIRSNFFETMFVQYVHTKERYYQELYHEIYTSGWTPYWFSALQLRLEVRQVLNDGVIWDNKKFGYSAYFNKNMNDADSCLIKWRQWYSQFYQNCREKEESENKFDNLAKLDW